MSLCHRKKVYPFEFDKCSRVINSCLRSCRDVILELKLTVIMHVTFPSPCSTIVLPAWLRCYSCHECKHDHIPYLLQGLRGALKALNFGGKKIEGKFLKNPQMGFGNLDIGLEISGNPQVCCTVCSLPAARW